VGRCGTAPVSLSIVLQQVEHRLAFNKLVGLRHRVIAVANLDELPVHQRYEQSGPTRDSRCKPEIAAPGTEVVAANGFAGRDDLWIAMTGTSMACPYVTGVVGLMLATNHEVTAAQCVGILQRTARLPCRRVIRLGQRCGLGRPRSQSGH
jgi:hypothetical protein